MGHTIQNATRETHTAEGHTFLSNQVAEVNNVIHGTDNVIHGEDNVIYEAI